MKFDLDTARRLGLSDGLIQALSAHPLTDAELNKHGRIWDTWENDLDGAKEYFEGVDKLTTLAIALNKIPTAAERYRQLGIPEEILWEGLRDIGIWCREYYKRTGDHGLIEWDWIAKTLDLKVFRLGRLQFEPRYLEEEINAKTAALPAGTPVVDVHIPAEEPLDMAEVQASLARAPEFMKKYLDFEYSYYHCHSWLLSNELVGMVGESSRIMQFRNMFDVYGVDTEERQAEERVFDGTLRDDPREYVAETSLQKNMKKYLIEVGPVTMGMGIFLR